MFHFNKYSFLISVFMSFFVCLFLSVPGHGKIIERKMHMVCQEHEEAYWNGSTGVCCDGEAYLTDSSADSQVYACCATDKEVSVVEGAPKKQHCCPKGQKAYWNGSSVGCCSTEAHKIVKNYKDGVGEAGYACCEILQEKYKEYDWYENLPPDIVTSKNYTIVGAVRGVCCGGYQDFIELSKSYDQMTHHDYYVYSIRQNGGIYYCATDFTMYTTDYEDKERDIYEAEKYINDSTYCYKDYNGGGYCECSISDSGDPQSSSNKKYIDECFL